MDDTTAASIKTTIREYLTTFDAHSKAIQSIISSCDIDAKALEAMPLAEQALVSRQRDLIVKVKSIEYELGVLINEKNEKKLERKHKELGKVRQELLDTAERLDSIQAKQRAASGCKGEATGMKERMQASMQVIVARLLNAKKAFPDMYMEVENELNVHFLTPPPEHP